MASFWYFRRRRRSCRRRNCRSGCTRARARGRTASTRSRAAAPWARDASPRCRSPSTRSTAHRAARGGPASGLTRMRSNRGESNFMTEHYAEAATTPSSLDRWFFRERRRASRRLTPAQPRILSSMQVKDSDRRKAHRGVRAAKPGRGGRIASARRPCRPPAGRRDPFPGPYRVGSVPRKEPGRPPPHDQPDTFG